MVAALLEAAPALCELCGILLECVTPAACDCCVNCAAVAMEPPLRGRGCGRRVGLVCFAATAGATLIATAASARLGYFDPAATVGIVEPVNPPSCGRRRLGSARSNPDPSRSSRAKLGGGRPARTAWRCATFPADAPTIRPSRGGAKEAKEAHVDDAASRNGSKAASPRPRTTPTR